MGEIMFRSFRPWRCQCLHDGRCDDIPSQTRKDLMDFAAFALFPWFSDRLIGASEEALGSLQNQAYLDGACRRRRPLHILFIGRHLLLARLCFNRGQHPPGKVSMRKHGKLNAATGGSCRRWWGLLQTVSLLHVQVPPRRRSFRRDRSRPPTPGDSEPYLQHSESNRASAAKMIQNGIHV